MSTTEPPNPRPKNADAHTPSPSSTQPVTSPTGPPTRDLKISVIVLSKDEPELATSLELLRPQCESLGAQCIVVDASEGRLESIHLTHPWTTWIDFSGPFWRSSTIPHQRNVGCHAATGDVIAFCDSGGEPDINWLTSITAPLLSGAFTLVCGPVYAKEAGVYSFLNDVPDGEVVDSAPTANLAFLKSVFDQVGGFDEQLFYGSDTDFVWRCSDAHHSCHQVRDAGMLMDFGNLSRTLRRSWLYGRGWARLYGLHPERHVRMMKNSPERIIYPAWILLGPPFLFAGRWRKLRWVPLAWLGVVGLLLARNRKAPNPRFVVADHIVGGASVLNETFRRISGETAPVIFLPDSQSPYLHHLADALKKQGTPVDFWSGPTKSATFNILLGPLWLILLAWRGTKIVHIHWTSGFSRSSGAVGGRAARCWFGVFLRVAHAMGLKIVWTAHNVLPHEAVFDDDLAAAKILAVNADAIIALSPHGAQEVSELFGRTRVTVISHGPLEIMSSPAGRDNARKYLEVGERACFSFFGYLRPYKGLETLIAAAEQLGSNVAVRITGQGDPTYIANLSRKVDAANATGADIRLEPRWRSDHEIADLLAASDVCVFPFARVDNSGSVLLALAAGLPVIIPDVPSLHHIDNLGVIRYDAANPVHALIDAMTTAANLSQPERVAIGHAAHDWALKFDWTGIAEETAAVYAESIRGK